MKQKISFIALGILITIISIEFSLRIAGGIFLFLQERKNLHSLQQKDSVVILCLGESTTALGGDSAYSHQLEKILKNFDPSQKYSVINKGVPAVSTTNILKHLEGYLDRYKPDIVVAMMGINDEIYSQSEPSSPNIIAKTFQSLRIDKLANWLAESLNKKAADTSYTSSDLWMGAGFAGRGISSEDLALSVTGDAQRLMKKAIELRNEENWQAALQIFQEALGSDPNNEWILSEIGLTHYLVGSYPEAIAAYEKAVALNCTAAENHFRLGLTYRLFFPSGEKEILAFEKAVELNPKKISYTMELATSYKHYNQAQKLEELFKKTIIHNPHHPWGYSALAQLYTNQGKINEAETYTQKAAALERHGYSQQTINNFLKMEEILDRRKIKLIAVQYPLRALMPLKNIFKDHAPIYFVDNEASFKAAVNENGYSAYFLDNFAGDFGHATERGNKLLAANISEIILQITKE